MENYQAELKRLEESYEKLINEIKEAYLPPNLCDCWQGPGKMKLQMLEIKLEMEKEALKEKYGVKD